MLMAMQSGNPAASDEIHGGGGEGLQLRQGMGQQSWHTYQPCLVQVNEKDGFITWLRGEFAAANAIIDALCHHLTVVGEAGEYDEVIGRVQQRKCGWNPVLYMQPYVDVNEVVFALQHVVLRKNLRKECRRGKVDETKGPGNVETDTHSESLPHRKETLTAVPTTFVGNEILDGKTVNVVDGLKLFEELFDHSEVSKLVTLVNDLRMAGKTGRLQGHANLENSRKSWGFSSIPHFGFTSEGQTFVLSKRPVKGHGREMIQIGLSIADAPPEDEVTAGTSKDWKIEPIPSLFEDVIKRLVATEVVSVNPDCCIIDIFNEGDHSRPHMWPQWFGRPVCVLFLTECDMTFGKVVGVERTGDYKGALRLSLMPGSMLSLERRSSDFAWHAIPSMNKQRVLVTFAKSLSKVTSGDVQRSPSAAVPLPSDWVPPPSKSPNRVRHPAWPKHCGPVPTSAPSARPALPPPNGIQPIYVPAAVDPASVGWPAAPPGHALPRSPVPGTGVFLPQSGSRNSANRSLTTNPTRVLLPQSGSRNSANQSSTTIPTRGTTNLEVLTVEENRKVNSDATNATTDEKPQHQECNGSIDGSNGKKSIAKEEQHPFPGTGGSLPSSVSINAADATNASSKATNDEKPQHQQCNGIVDGSSNGKRSIAKTEQHPVPITADFLPCSGNTGNQSSTTTNTTNGNTNQGPGVFLPHLVLKTQRINHLQPILMEMPIYKHWLFQRIKILAMLPQRPKLMKTGNIWNAMGSGAQK